MVLGHILVEEELDLKEEIGVMLMAHLLLSVNGKLISLILLITKNPACISIMGEKENGMIFPVTLQMIESKVMFVKKIQKVSFTPCYM